VKSSYKLSCAVMAILGAHASASHAAEAASSEVSGTEIADIIVTAQRRSESIQNVPITVQALTAETLTQLSVTTFDDYIKYLPNVTSQGLGPGQNNIYMRGLSTAVGGLQGSGVVGSFPNVAVYLDDQSAQLPGRNLDIYAADLERIEVLEGPQGTLFGAGAQAGVVRYITNKPKLDVVEAHVSAGYSTTAHGDPSNTLEAVLNLPLVTDKAGLRAVIYNESRGGYINNIPGTFARANTDLGIGYAYAAAAKQPATGPAGCAGPPNAKGYCVPANSITINNGLLVGKAINPVTYKGMRVEGLVKFNDDWNLLVSQSYQNMEADGIFSQAATDSLGQPQPPLSVQLYNPSFDKDKFTNTSWTLNGRIGALKAVYTGGYLVRNVDQVQDYTNYARGPYMDYYQCGNPSYTATNSPTYVKNPATAFCATPSATWRDTERNEHLSHEFRLSTPDDWRVRAIGGLFYENYKIGEIVDWNYLTANKVPFPGTTLPGFAAGDPWFNPIGPPTGYYADAAGNVVNQSGPLKGRPYRYNDPGVHFVASGIPSVNNPNVRPGSVGFFDDIRRGYTQEAAFASLDFDLVPKKLTLTVGTRYYRIDSSEKGAVVGSFGCTYEFHPSFISNSAFNPLLPPGPTNLQYLPNPKSFPGSVGTGGKGAVPNPCVNHSNETNLDSLGLDKLYTGFKSRANLNYHVTDDAIVYATWSQGFRAGGFNRPNSVETSAGGSPLAGIWLPPVIFKPDVLTNKEIGWKTEWMNRRVQFNGAIYQEDWKDAQISVFDPGVTGNLTFTTNGGAYKVKGLETTLVARVTHELTLTAAASWNHTELTDEASIVDLSGKPIIWTSIFKNGKPLSNPAGLKGDPLAGAPPFQANVRLRYEFMLGDYEAFWQLAGLHTAHQFSSTDRLTKDLQGNSVAYNNDAYSTYDGAVGMSKDAWTVQLYGQNLTDTRAALWTNQRQWYKSETVNRPRVLGLTFTYKFVGAK
jgi:iron complex outermembrane recepter protein